MPRKTYIDPTLAPELERATLRRILGFVRPFWRPATAVIALILATSMLDLLPPLFVKRLVDVAIPTANVRLLIGLAIGMVAAPLAADVLGMGQKYLTTWIGEHAMLDLRVRLFRHLHRQGIGYFAAIKPGEAVSRILNDVEGVGSVVEGTLFDIVDDVIVVATTLVVIFALDVRLALLSVTMLPLFIFPTRRVGKVRKQLKRQSQARKAELTGILTETLSVSGALLLKVFGAAELETERFRAKADELVRLSLQQTLVGRQYQMLIGLFKNIGPALVFGFGGWIVMQGNGIGIGTLVAFVTLIKRLYGPASSLVGVHIDIVVSYAYFDRIFGVLDLVPSIEDAPDALRPASLRGELRFDDVSFAYDKTGQTLSHIDLALEPGQMVAVVGLSGGGKSTLAMLVPRLYDVTGGAVLVDGHDVRALAQDWLRDQIAVVTQETYLFHTSVLENLRYGRPDATEAEVIEAAKAAQIHDLIRGLPSGYDTVAGDRGYRFSGGERQRLAIARAILKNPRILILDEATSSLDSHNEALVQAALAPLMAGRTSLVIAHRLSTIVAADQIVVIQGGRIVERGTHGELVAAGGAYAGLWAEQVGTSA
ncbi:MAG: ABC transporter ATP-binding protein [Ardenticatenales bacterium]